LAKKFSISGFPTIKYFKGGKPSDYSGGRTESEIVNWVLKKSGPAAKTLVTEEDLTAAQESNDAIVVGVYSSDNSDKYKVFMSYAAMDDENTFFVTTSEAIRNKLAVTGDAVVVLKSFDEGRNDFPVTSDDGLGKSLEQFLSRVTVPLIQEFSQAASKKIFGSPVKVSNSVRIIYFLLIRSMFHLSRSTLSFSPINLLLTTNLP
jgi:protein disulfide-isomerase A1